jgi:hypothetical protein
VETEQVIQWMQLFKTDTRARKRAATEMAYLGMRHRARSRAERVDAAPGVPDPYPGLAAGELIAFLDAALSDPREQIQCEAIFAVGELAGLDMLSPLAERLHCVDQGSCVHAELRRSIAKIGGVEAYQILQGYDDPDGVRDMLLLHMNETRDKEFAQEFQAPQDRGPMLTGKLRLARDMREWLEGIREQYKGGYLGFLAEQVL